MRKFNIHFICSMLILMLPGNINPQTAHDVTVANFSFTPAALTITVGDTVRWTNVLGNHNVVADDNSFTSGPLAPAPWVYTHVFTTAGSNPYYCSLHGGPGGVGMSGVITVQTATDVQDDGNLIYKFDLKQNYPNPFNPTTTIQFDLPEDAVVTLKIYNMLGQEVQTLLDREDMIEGTQEVQFNAQNLSSGVYFYRIVAETLDEDGAKLNTFQTVKKMILIK